VLAVAGGAVAIDLISFMQLPYDPMRDFTPVAMVCSLGTHPDMCRLGRALFTQADAIGVGELGLWVAREEFIWKNRAVLVDFLEDYLRSVRFYRDPANHKEAVDIAANFSKLPAAVFDDWLFTNKDYYRDPDGRVDMKSVQASFDTQRELGFLKTNIDAGRYVDFTTIEEAVKRLN
jgi:ABC-type nitrate/sulfonate/bicarbonate transport system substrate-binding protein